MKGLFNYFKSQFTLLITCGVILLFGHNNVYAESMCTCSSQDVQNVMVITFIEHDLMDCVVVTDLTDVNGKNRKFRGSAKLIFSDSNDDTPLKVIEKVKRNGKSKYTFKSFKGSKIRFKMRFKTPAISNNIIRPIKPKVKLNRVKQRPSSMEIEYCDNDTSSTAYGDSITIISP